MTQEIFQQYAAEDTLMLFRTNSVSKLLTSLSLLALSCVGCGKSGFDSHFVAGETTKSLIPEAQEGFGDHPGVNQLVEERFGTPQKLAVWRKMPVNAGGISGSVAEDADATVPVKSLKLTFEGDPPDLSDGGALLQVVTGTAAREVVTLTEWSADTGIGEVDPPLQNAPKTGDVIVVNGGKALKHGRVLYMRHCSHCHGTSGDGAGPTAEYLYPRPRDYRAGKFKFTSTKSLMRPARDDIHRILKNGIPGTYMPSFVPMLDAEGLESVVEYVRFLAMRGEFEIKIAGEFNADFSQEEYEKRLEGESRQEIMEALEEFFADELPDYINDDGDALALEWNKAEDKANVVVPSVARVKDSVESRRRGRELFVGAKLNCINCHGVTAEGNGPQTEDFELVDGKPRPNPGLHDDWGHLVKPRDLTTGIYRGGRRPLDVFRRLYSGINGAKMPAFGGKIPDEQLWDVVNYVLSIPYDDGVEPGHIPVSDEAAATASASL